MNDTSRYSNRHFQFGAGGAQVSNLNQPSPRTGYGMSNPRLAGGPGILRHPNFHSNDSAVLQQRLAELENELNGLDMEYDRLNLDNDELKEQHEDIKAKNKMLFEQLTH